MKPQYAAQFLKNSLPQVQTLSIGEGLSGNIDTIKFMIQVAHDRKGHPKVQWLARRIINQANIPSHYYIDEALAIGDFVKNNVRYIRDPDGIEQLQDPLTMIENLESGKASGDCDDMALLIATLLLSVGHVPSFRAVRYKGSFGNFNHIYVVDYDKNTSKSEVMRVVLDAIMKDKPIGYEVPHASGKEFKT